MESLVEITDYRFFCPGKVSMYNLNTYLLERFIYNEFLFFSASTVYVLVMIFFHKDTYQILTYYYLFLTLISISYFLYISETFALYIYLLEVGSFTFISCVYFNYNIVKNINSRVYIYFPLVMFCGQYIPQTKDLSNIWEYTEVYNMNTVPLYYIYLPLFVNLVSLLTLLTYFVYTTLFLISVYTVYRSNNLPKSLPYLNPQATGYLGNPVDFESNLSNFRSLEIKVS